MSGGNRFSLCKEHWSACACMHQQGEGRRKWETFMHQEDTQKYTSSVKMTQMHLPCQFRSRLDWERASEF
jgi:hypothetical protein